jgi:hypothetical protein
VSCRNSRVLLSRDVYRLLIVPFLRQLASTTGMPQLLRKAEVQHEKGKPTRYAQALFSLAEARAKLTVDRFQHLKQRLLEYEPFRPHILSKSKLK